MAFLDARRAFQARLHQTSIEGLTRTVRDTLRSGALRQGMLDPAAPLEIHRLSSYVGPLTRLAGTKLAGTKH